jgi:hypothetical protein
MSWCAYVPSRIEAATYIHVKIARQPWSPQANLARLKEYQCVIGDLFEPDALIYAFHILRHPKI